MPCVPLPKPLLPSLPPGLTLTAPIPQLPTLSEPGACCILPALSTPKIPIPLPKLVVNPAFVAILRTGLDAAEAFFDSIQVDCPRS